MSDSNSSTWEPSVTAFICSWCAAGAAGLAGDSQKTYPAGVRIIQVPCVARINPLYIMKALQGGSDGVLVVGCHPGDCHYISGNLVQRRKFGVMKRFLANLGINPDRVQIAWVTASEGIRFASLVDNIVEDIKKIGPQKNIAKEAV